MTITSEHYRTHLPINKPVHPIPTLMDANDTDPAPPYEMLRPPPGAPNVLLILLDDMGFGVPSAFGGACSMPASERLAESGLKYNRFHTTALCSPTRASLLTGRNHHQVGMSSITETATSYSGADSVRPPTAAPLAEMLRLNGYSTAAFGKWHQCPVWEASLSGPFNHWPTGEGFEHFYGFMGGETDQWHPTLFDGVTPVNNPEQGDPDYHLAEDLAARTINYIRQQKAITPDKPFYTYLAFGGTHAPHHVPKPFIEQYKGKFDQGWDKVREETFERQKKLGIIPADAKLTERPESIQEWDKLSADEKRLFARMAEVYAGYASHTDAQVGKVLDALDEMGIMDDTLVFYILGDNGGSGEAGLLGTTNEYASYNLVEETVPEMLKKIDLLGSDQTFNHYPVGWAHAMDTPFQWVKQIASHWGGTRNGMIVHWPKGFKSKGELRSQFTHVIDIAPTVLAAARLPEPATVHGVDQIPLPGYDMSYSFDDAKAEEVHNTQYFEIVGNRAIYHKGWSACTIHTIPWDLNAKSHSLAEDNWELYAPEDYSQANNVAKDHPEMLAKLQALFLIEAAKNNVFPLDDRKFARFDPKTAGRPELMGDRTSMTLYEGMRHMGENTVINVKNRSHTVTAKVTVNEGDHGVIIAQGGRFGGWTMYLDAKGVPTYAYNWVNLENYVIKAPEPLKSGDHELRFEFDYDGGGAGKGGNGRLYVDGKEAGGTRIEHTCGVTFALTDGLDVGSDSGSVTEGDYGSYHGAFQGKIHSVLINVDPKHHHDLEANAAHYMKRQ